MERLARLERSKTFWFLLATSLLFFLLRIPSLFEPYWYGDEGIYEVLGFAMRHGRLLYTGIFDNKPPLLYVLYALVNGDQFGIRFLSLLFGFISVMVFFCLSHALFKRQRFAAVATIIFAFIFAIPYVEGNIANAENFMILPILTAGLVIYHHVKQKTFPKSAIIAGVLLGVAFLFKIVAIFDLAAFALFIIFQLLPENFQLRRDLLGPKWRVLRPAVIAVGAITIGFCLPFFFTVCYFLVHGALIQFLQATFVQNVGYVGYKNQFVIPQGLLIVKLLLLGGLVVGLFANRKKISPPALFIILWFAFSVFNAFFSQRPYTHYILVAITSYALMWGLISQQKKFFLPLAALFILITHLLLSQFTLFGARKTVLYYQNFISYLSEAKTLASYQSFFDHKTPRDYQIASYLNSRLGSNRIIFIWGNSAQIYRLSNTLPPGRFTVAYHIGSKKTVEETTKDFYSQNPAFVVIMRDTGAIPFMLKNYTYQVTIQDVDIYKRI